MWLYVWVCNYAAIAEIVQKEVGFVCLQGLVHYGLYRFVVEQLDELIARGKGASVSIRRHEADWLCECHVVCDYAVKTIVLGVVVGGTGWEKRMLDNVVPVLLILPHASSMRVYSTESDTRIGYALAASVGIVDPLVVGRVTQVWLFDLVRKHFLAEFVGLDPLSVLDYLRVRLASVVQERVLDRLPRSRQVSILNYTCIVCGISKDI